MLSGNKTREQILKEIDLLNAKMAKLKKSEIARENAEKALKESEEKFRILYESSRDAIMMLAPPTWLFTAGNQATIKMFHAKNEKEFISKEPWKLSPKYQPDGQLSSEKAKKMIKKAMKTGSNFFEWTHKRINGEEFPATVLLTRIELKDKRLLQATVRDITERKRIEEELNKHREHLEELVDDRTKALKESEKKYRAIFESFQDLYYRTDMKGNLTLISPSVTQFGYDQDKMIDLPISDFYVNPKDRKILMKKILKEGVVQDYEVLLKKKNGNCVNSSLTARIVLDDEGLPVGIEGVFRDITKRKQAEKNLKKNEQFLNSILESVQDGVSVLNPDLTVRHVNGKMNKWYKENLPLEGKKCYEVYHNADKPCDPCPTIRCLGSGSTEWNIVPGLLGSPVEWIELFSYPIKDPNSDKVTGVVEFVRDITERKQAEETIKENEILLRKIIDTSPNCIYVKDRNGYYILVNKRMAELHKTTPEALVGTSDLSIAEKWLTTEEKIEQFRASERNVIDRNQPLFIPEEEFIYRDGTTKWFQTTKLPITLKNNPGCLMSVAVDITERKKAEKIQKTLFNISNTLNTVDNMQDLYSKIRGFLGNVIDTTNFYVALYDEKTDMISLPFDVDEKDDYETFPAGKTITKFVIKTGKPLLATKNIVKKLIKKGLIETVGATSEIWLGVPLKIENKVIGVIAVQSYDDPHLYAEKDKEILTFVSEEIALAIQHKQADEQIKKDLEEKNILLQEVHHRIKNNMQVVSSLLRLQSSYVEDEKALELFKNSQNRVRSMALIHELLYRSKDMANIDFAEYVKSLTTQLLSSFDINTNFIKLKMNIKDILLDINLVTPCGFIINELVSNSLKYGFPAIGDKPEGRKGEVSIDFTFENETYVLSVKDNGIGISEEIDLKNPQTLGLMLVNIFIKQLNGTLELEKVKGTSFKISFKKKTIKTYSKV
jgi:PAS domain S-box-containing protein